MTTGERQILVDQVLWERLVKVAKQIEHAIDEADDMKIDEARMKIRVILDAIDKAGLGR